ncbi:ABC transporter substrate-binding protein [Gordonia sp. PDNC005]|uniref:glycine betaine ABC transporter substrate-binding protein n=1 Tax=unclassified Gordonia (in: high G+C Gram-positive bacteria) TaxID=2657482 RepID=UPI001966C965|nr:glycine betaine ABC transporter substrate-binding protein [Gordonia sp. PDNC005]QRY63566.1 ABC transporter substrate-binding protein [Gordonia sp. PDNC005]
MRTQRRILTALLSSVLAAVLLTACSDDETTVIVGHDGTPEMQVAAAVYAGALARTGVAVDTRDGGESQPRLLDAVASGDLGLFPAFTGSLLEELTPKPSAVTSEDVLADVNRSLPQQVSIGDPALVSNRWQVLARTDEIERRGVKDLADCGRFGRDDAALVVTTNPPVSVREAVAPCRTRAVTSVGSADELVAEVRTGGAFGLTTAIDLATVEDLADVQAIPSKGTPIAQDLVPVFASGLLGKSQLKALSRVAGELTTADLAQMVREVRSGSSPRAAAGQWLATHSV